MIITICTVTTLTFTSSPAASTTVRVGIDSQPFTIPFTVTQVPACGKTVSFSHTPTTPAFVTLTSLTATGGNVQVTGATIANHNTYSFVLTAAVDAQSITSNFNVVIKDPCSTSIFETTPAPFVDMNVSLPSVATST